MKATHFPYDLNKTYTADSSLKPWSKQGSKQSQGKSRNHNEIKTWKTESSAKSAVKN